MRFRRRKTIHLNIDEVNDLLRFVTLFYDLKANSKDVNDVVTKVKVFMDSVDPEEYYLIHIEK